MSLEEYLQAIPKAELHVHLEGTVRPATLLKLAQRNAVSLPVQTIDEARQWFRFRDFNHFIDIYLAITGCLKTSEDYEQIVYEFGESMAQQNIRYAEVTFSPSTHHYGLGTATDTFLSGLARGRQRVRQDFGLEIRWIFDIVRNDAQGPGLSQRADYTTSVAIEYQHEGVVALGLGGAEVGYPPEWFERWFDQALSSGLHSIPHAGETAGPASVWGALKALKAERIGHGVRSIEDPALITYLAAHQIPLEVSPTSNICLGVYPDYAHHSLPDLLAAGIPITINSDDPPLFNTTLNDEIALLASAFHLDFNTIQAIVLNGVRYSLLPQSEKETLTAYFQAEMQVLQNSYLP
jgi:aminodeoxyfutalosine deaminase